MPEAARLVHAAAGRRDDNGVFSGRGFPRISRQGLAVDSAPALGNIRRP
jgi:hypothetical protein